MTTTVTLTLGRPITVGGKPVAEFTLREPTGADLRGIMLTNLIQGSVAAHAALLPRIATPHLTRDQVELAPIGDHLRIMRALQGFFADGATDAPETEETADEEQARP